MSGYAVAMAFGLCGLVYWQLSHSTGVAVVTAGALLVAFALRPRSRD